MNDLLEMGTTVLNSQPFSLLIGATLEDLQPGIAELSLVITKGLKQQHGFVHGGVVSYLADNAITFAGGSILGDCVTAEYKINYIAPAVGHKLYAKAEVVKAGKRQAVCKCEILAVEEHQSSIVAFASGSVRKIERV